MKSSQHSILPKNHLICNKMAQVRIKNKIYGYLGMWISSSILLS